MAIKISGVAVIDDTKNITNISNVSLTGTLSVGSSPSTGTAGQVLTSNGSSAPTWTTLSSVSTGKSIVMSMIFGG